MSTPFDKPVDEFLRHKWSRMFYHFFDLNKSGEIDWDDFEVLFERIKEIRGANSTEYKIVQDAMLMVWKGLLITVGKAKEVDPVDKSAVITLPEWETIWKKFDPKHQQPWQKEYLVFMFMLIDTSGDKLIDEGEFAEVMKLYGVGNNAAVKSFHKATGGKAIDYGQFVHLWNEYFTSTDKNAPGSWLFGPPC